VKLLHHLHKRGSPQVVRVDALFDQLSETRGGAFRHAQSLAQNRGLVDDLHTYQALQTYLALQSRSVPLIQIFGSGQSAYAVNLGCIILFRSPYAFIIQLQIGIYFLGTIGGDLHGMHARPRPFLGEKLPQDGPPRIHVCRLAEMALGQ
jgi:hypothetical protein